MITWDRWTQPCVFAFFLKLVIRKGVTCFQLTASKALLQESLHVRTFSRSEVLLGMGRVEKGVVSPSECVSHALRKHLHKPEGTGIVLKWLHQALCISISPSQPFQYIFLYPDLLLLKRGELSFGFVWPCFLFMGNLVLWLQKKKQKPARPYPTMGAGLPLGVSDCFRVMAAPHIWTGEDNSEGQDIALLVASTACSYSS